LWHIFPINSSKLFSYFEIGTQIIDFEMKIWFPGKCSKNSIQIFGI
jgi:hypothetical protein